MKFRTERFSYLVLLDQLLRLFPKEECEAFDDSFPMGLDAVVLQKHDIVQYRHSH